MSSRSWVQALSASAATAISRVNYAYLISFIQFGIPPILRRLVLADFLILCVIPTTLSRYVPPARPDRLLVVLSCSNPSWHILSASTYHLCSTLSPTYFVRSYVCAHTIPYAYPPLTFLLVLLWTILGFRVPVDCCILARLFRFSGLIHLLIWVFLCESMHYFSLIVSFCCSVPNITGLRFIMEHACWVRISCSVGADCNLDS